MLIMIGLLNERIHVGGEEMTCQRSGTMKRYALLPLPVGPVRKKFSYEAGLLTRLLPKVLVFPSITDSDVYWMDLIPDGSVHSDASGKTYSSGNCPGFSLGSLLIVHPTRRGDPNLSFQSLANMAIYFR